MTSRIHVWDLDLGFGVNDSGAVVYQTYTLSYEPDWWQGFMANHELPERVSFTTLDGEQVVFTLETGILFSLKRRVAVDGDLTVEDGSVERIVEAAR